MPEPSYPKNPYTNQFFNDLEMYQIYTYLKKNNYKDMLYFDLFYKYQFDIDEFTYNCFKILKADIITQTVKDGDIMMVICWDI